MHAGHKVKLTGLLVPAQDSTNTQTQARMAETPARHSGPGRIEKASFWWIPACGKVCIGGLKKRADACLLPTWVWEWNKGRLTHGSCCLHVNKWISELSLEEGVSHGHYGMPFSSVLPKLPSPFTLSLLIQAAARLPIMEYLTDSESLYCFPCHLSYQSLHSRRQDS